MFLSTFEAIFLNTISLSFSKTAFCLALFTVLITAPSFETKTKLLCAAILMRWLSMFIIVAVASNSKNGFCIG